MLRVGCPLWANRDWVGRYFPPGTRPGDELGAYARVLNAVEGNTTFYALPSAPTVERWREQVPPEFRFVCKLPRTITHERRLRHAVAELREACDRLALLGDGLGPISVQLPGSFGPDDLPVLAQFLASLPTELPWAVEVRHPAFAANGSHERALDDLLRAHGVDRVLLDSRALFAGPASTREEIAAFHSKPRLRVRPTATAGHPIVRFIGQTDPEANPAFWAPWVVKVAAWLDAGLEPIVFVHTPDNAAAPALARRFHDEVRRLAPTQPPLPEPPPCEPGAGPAVEQPALWSDR